MSIHKRLPESIRAFGEQLQFLRQPRVWGSISVLAIVGIFFWQFSENPELFSLDQQTLFDSENPASELTPEEQSIAADIDSSKFLVKELKTDNTEIIPVNPMIQVETNLLKQANSASEAQVPSSESNPFLEILPIPSNPSQSKNNTSLSASDSLKPSFGTTSSPASSNVNTNQLGSPAEATAETSPPISPLQQAMQQYLQNESTTSTNTTENTGNTTNPSANTTAPSSLSPNSLTNPSQALNGTSGLVMNATPFNSSPTITGQLPQSNWTVPRTNPNLVPGTVPTPVQNPYQTNTTLPPAVPPVPTAVPGGQYSNLNLYPNTNPAYPNPNLNNVPSYPGSSNYSNTSPSYTTVQPVQPSTYMTPSNMNPNLQPSQLAQPQTPYSVPNRIPGSYIGGGRINTFANP